VVVPLAEAPPTDATDGRRVVVGVDGSSSSRRALEWALAEARPGDEVDAVTAFDRQLWWAVTDADVVTSIETAAAASAAETLDTALSGLAVPQHVRLTRRILPGEPWRVLVDRAEHADLLVVGSRGRGGFAGLLLGSVSHRCAERSARPVVVVPAPRDAVDGSGEES
jgi:nucleotide-binding universal stress UspA family protein